MLELLRIIASRNKFPAFAKAEIRKDLLGLPSADPGIQRAIDAAVAWLCRAQDNSASHDGGLASHFSLLSGWSTSYPEVTGYVVPTMLACARSYGDEALRQRARRMLDWLVSIQFSDGAFQGGLIDCKPVLPVTFNTGQILFGLAAGAREFGVAYRTAMRRAADWLVQTQYPDGCWRKYPTPFAEQGEKTYETHVAWALLEAARVEPDKAYVDAALANVQWALSLQRENGWFDKCCLTDPSQPLTHTLGYALRGLMEAYRFSDDPSLLHAAVKTGDGLLTALRYDGFLAGRLYANWRPAVRWACLTGSVQISHCWLMLYQYTREVKYRDAAYVVNRYIRRTMKIDGPYETRGAIKGSFPVYVGYRAYDYPSWACKFFIDANLLEKTVREAENDGHRVLCRR